MAELIYPAFPRRAFLAAAMVVAVLVAAAVAANRAGPSASRCTAAAERVLASTGRTGPGPIPGCAGLSSGQYARALTAAYRAEYGRYLRADPITASLPPPAYRALSARRAAGT